MSRTRSYRPWQLPAHGPSTGLSIFSGLAQGFNQGMDSYMQALRYKQQNALMQSRIAAQSANTAELHKLRQSQIDANIETNRMKQMGGDMSKISLLQTLKKDGSYDPKVLRDFESKYMDRVMTNIKPEEALAVKQRLEADQKQGRLSPEFQQYANPTENELKYLGQTQGQQAGLQRTQMTVQGGLQREQMRGEYGLEKADVYGSYKSKSEAIKATTAEMNKHAAAIKGGGIFSGLDENSKAISQSKWDAAHDRLLQIENAPASAFGKGGQGVAAPAPPPPVLSVEDAKKNGAKVGDLILHPGGKQVGVVTALNPDGTPHIGNTLPYTPSQGSPQSVPDAQQGQAQGPVQPPPVPQPAPAPDALPAQSPDSSSATSDSYLPGGQ